MQLGVRVALVCAVAGALAPSPAKARAVNGALLKQAASTALAGLISASSSESDVRRAVISGPGSRTAARASNAATSAGSRVNKDAESLLRNGLPITNGEVRELQRQVEEIKDNLRAKRVSSASNNVEQAKRIVGKKGGKIAVGEKAAEITERLDRLMTELAPISTALASIGPSGSPQERDALDLAGRRQAAAATLVSEIEARLVPKGFKVMVPEEYAGLPRLDGRARVEFVLKKAEKGDKFSVDSVLYDTARLEMIVDGYTAPLTSGNFLDLVKKGFYNGMVIQRSDGFVVQTGDPDGPEGPKIGYEENGKVRKIPLEIKVETDKEPMYGLTTEDDLRGAAQTALKFQSYGALGMARDEYDPDSASSQWFWLLFDSDLTPAGKNLLDGRYACFGYTVVGDNFLTDVKEGDVIVSAKILRAPPPFGDYTGVDP